MRMKSTNALVLLMFLLAGGCMSKSTARREAEKAYLRGQRDAAKETQQKQLQNLQPSVTVLGNVANRTIPWNDTLTASQAIVAAQYQARMSPTTILVHRQGQTHSLSVRLLLNGLQDLPLEPGDVVELR